MSNDQQPPTTVQQISEMPFAEPPKTQADTLIDSVIDGKYRVLERISHGGIGVVYKAEHTLMNRVVALKVLHSHLVQDAEWLQRFRREAQIASKLTHPNAILIYDYGVHQGLPYLVMQLAEGKTLKEVLKSEQRLSLPRICKIFCQVCSALKEAHSLGIVHRDLKPENIMLAPKAGGQEWVGVLDFGIAKLAQQSGEPSLAGQKTQVGTFFGTPKYAAPEQVLGKPIDGRTDLYALGILLFECMSGAVPFDEPTMMSTLLKQVNETPPNLRQERPDLKLPKIVDDILGKCLAKDPAQRFQNVEQLSEILSELHDQITQRRIRILRRGVQAVALGCVLGAIGILLGEGWNWFYSQGKASKQDRVTNDSLNGPQIATVVDLGTPRNAEPPEGSPPDLSAPTKELSTTPVAKTEEKGGTDHRAPSESPPLTTSPVSTTSGGSAAAILESEEEVPEEPVHQSPQLPTSDSSTNSTNTISGSITAQLNSDQLTPTQPSDSSSATQVTASAVAPSVAEPPVNTLSQRTDASNIFTEAERLYRRKLYSEALEFFDRGLQLKPASMKARLNAGNCALRLGRRAEALQHFSAAQKIDGGYAPVYFNLACYYARGGDTQRAIDHLERMIHLNPRSRSWVRDEADLSSLHGDPRFERITQK